MAKPQTETLQDGDSLLVRCQPWLASMWILLGPAVGAIPLDSVLWVWWSALPLLGLTMHLAYAQQQIKKTQPATSQIRKYYLWLWHPWWWLAIVGWLAITITAFFSPDPAVAAGMWWQWTVTMSGCWWLYQLRHQLTPVLLFAILSVALFQVSLGLFQKIIVFPHLVQEIKDAAAANADHPLVNRFGSKQILERLRNGGVYGSLLLANIYALVCGIGALIAVSKVRENKFLILPATLCLIGVWLSGAKGATLAVCAGAALSWMFSDLKKRWWVIIVLTIGTAVAWSTSKGAQLSLAVRLDYWQAAFGIIQEHPLFGVGLDGYRYVNWNHLPMDAEWSRYPHNSWLMLAVSGGVGLAILALMITGRLLWRNTHAHISIIQTSAEERSEWFRYWFPAAIAMTIIIFMGGFGSDNFDSINQNKLFAVTLACLFAYASLAAALPIVTGLTKPQKTDDSRPVLSLWSIRAVFIAWILSASIDFPHQTPGAMTVLAVIVALLIPQGRTEGNKESTPSINPAIIHVQLIIVVLFGLTGFFAMQRAHALAEADAFLQASRGEQQAILLQHADKRGPEAEASIRQVATRMLATAQQWPMAREQSLRLTGFLIDPRHRLATLNEYPWQENHKWWTTRAAAAAQAGLYDLAAEYQLKACAQAPQLLMLRRQLIRYLEQARAATSSIVSKEAFTSQITELKASIKNDFKRVHPRHRR